MAFVLISVTPLPIARTAELAKLLADQDAVVWSPPFLPFNRTGGGRRQLIEPLPFAEFSLHTAVRMRGQGPEKACRQCAAGEPDVLPDAETLNKTQAADVLCEHLRSGVVDSKVLTRNKKPIIIPRGGFRL